MYREEPGWHGPRAGRHLSAVREMLRRVIVGALLGTALLGGGARVVAAAPDSLGGLEANYDVSATITWGEGRLDVVSTATVTNNSDAAVDALTFNAVPAKIGSMDLVQVLVGPDAANAEVDDQSIIVQLPAPLEPTQQTSVTISYRAWFGGTNGNKRYLFAKVDGVATAYRWIPWLSRAYEFRTPTFGEPFVTKVANEVRVSITTDRGMPIATSGERVGVDGLTQTFVAHNVRDFNFAASPKFDVATGSWGGVSITYYYLEYSLSKLRTWTLAALDRFSQRVGAYPYNTLAVAEVPTGPSMESPSMIWVSQSARRQGIVKWAIVHEMAHQWFYGVVGNDQAIEPFADEALAEFLTRDLLGHTSSNCAESVLDMRVYDYSAACYYDVVYVQGDDYLEEYRQRVGDAAFWDGMRRYFDDNRFKIGGTRSLLEALDAAAAGAGGNHESRFPSLYPGAGG